MSALKGFLVRPASKAIREEFKKSFGYDLPAIYRSKMLNFLIWNKVSYRTPRGLPLEKAELRQTKLISDSLWGGLALATADDEADTRVISVEQFDHRLNYVFQLVVASFDFFLDEKVAQFLHKGTDFLCPKEEVEMQTEDLTDLEEMIARYAPAPHTVELHVNTFGAVLFGRSLASFVEMLYAGGTGSRRIFHLVGLIEAALREGIEGQVQSMSLVDGAPMTFVDFLEKSHMLAAPIAKILTYSRSPDSLEKVRRHYKKYDPTIFQFILDDLPDYFEDCASGKVGIIHALIYAQSDLGKNALWALKKERDTVEIAETISMNFLHHGDWSSASNYVPADDRLAHVSFDEVRQALENCPPDPDISIVTIAAEKVALGDRLRLAMEQRNLRECADVLLQSEVLRKFVSGVRDDQRRVGRIDGVTSRTVRLLPSVAKILAARCYIMAWFYRASWRKR